MANQVSKITTGSSTIQIPIATTEAPGIAKFNTNDFMVATDGTVTSKQKLGAAQFIFNVLPVIQSTSTGYQYQWSYNTQYPGVNATTLIKDVREIFTDMVILYTGPDDDEHDLRSGNLYRITQVYNTGATSVYLFSTNDTGYIGTLRGPAGVNGAAGRDAYVHLINFTVLFPNTSANGIVSLLCISENSTPMREFLTFTIYINTSCSGKYYPISVDSTQDYRFIKCDSSNSSSCVVLSCGVGLTPPKNLEVYNSMVTNFSDTVL